MFRLLVVGSESAAPILIPVKTDAQSRKAQLALVQQLAEQIERDIAALTLGRSDIAEELAGLDQARADLLKTYEASRLEVAEAERDLAAQAHQLRQAESRLLVVEGLRRRFELLDTHYQSDLERLGAVREAGTLLEALPRGSCPVCGAPLEAHRREQATEHYRTDDVRVAAEREAEKILGLRADLKKALAELSNETSALEGQRSQLRTDLGHVQSRISQELTPRVRSSATQLQEQVARRDLLLRAGMLSDQLADLRARGLQLEARGASRRGPAAPDQRDRVTTASMEAFALQVEEIPRRGAFRRPVEWFSRRIRKIL